MHCSGLPTTSRSTRWFSNLKSLSCSIPCRKRLAVRDPARDLREVEPVLRADRGPPVALDLIEVVGDPAVAEECERELVGCALPLALGPVGVRPFLDHVDVVQRIARPRRSETRGAADARERHGAHPEAAAVLRKRPNVPLHLVIRALVVDLLTRPETAHDRDRLLEQRDLVRRRAAEQLELRLVVPIADAEDHAPSEITSTCAACSATWTGL